MSRSPGADAHVVVCGLDNLGIRTAQELRQIGTAVVVIAERPRHDFASVLSDAGAALVVGSCRNEATLRAARVPDARSIVLLEDDDVGNLHAALTAQELNPSLRIVLRMFHRELGGHVRQLFHDAVALSASALAAPAFVRAAIEDGGEQRLDLDGHVLGIGRESPSSADVVLSLADLVSADGEEPHLSDGQSLCLVRRNASATPAPVDSRWRRLRDGVRYVDRRLLALLGFVALLISVSAIIFHIFAGLEPVDALYFTVTVVTTTGFGDINLRDAPAPLKLYGAALMLLGASSLAILFGLVADIVVGARLARQFATVPSGVSGHVVVCGLGNLGFRVVESLARQGIAVAATEVRSTDFIGAARRLGVPVLQADARHRTTLEALGVRRARCLIAATDDDVANLEAGLGASALNPSLRIVLRLFEPDLAVRVERAFGIHLSRSVSALAAPAFAAAALGHEVLASVSLGSEIIVLVRLRVPTASNATGRRIVDIERDGRARILLVDPRRGPERPRPDRLVQGGDDILLVATRNALRGTLMSFRRSPAAVSTVGKDAMPSSG